MSTTASLVSRSDDALLRAVKLGDADTVAQLLSSSSHGYDLSKTKYQHYAALYGHAKVLKILIDSGIQINQPSDFMGMTCLYLACMRGHEAVFNLLLKQADIQLMPQLPSSEQTPLDILLFNICADYSSGQKAPKHEQMVKTYLHALKNKKSAPEGHWCARMILRKQETIAIEMLKCFPQLRAYEYEGKTLMNYAEDAGAKEVLMVLATNGNNAAFAIYNRQLTGQFPLFSHRQQGKENEDMVFSPACSSSSSK